MTWDDERLHAQVGRVEQLLSELAALRDQPAGTVADRTLAAVVDLYGEALARVVGLAEQAGVLPALVEDELVEHLLLVHDLHPYSVETRVRHVVDELEAGLRARGAELDLLSVESDVVRLRFAATGCPSTARELAGMVEEAVRRIAPEVGRVELVSPAPEPVLVAIDQVLRAPSRPGG